MSSDRVVGELQNCILYWSKQLLSRQTDKWPKATSRFSRSENMLVDR
jgi:hypothetical protein